MTVQGCVGTAQAIQALGDRDSCRHHLPVFRHADDRLSRRGGRGIVPDGWYFGG